MYISKIILENIRSYIRQVIDFPYGSVLLSGDIGSGKSTILQAMEFALFGLRRKHLSGASLLRNGEKQGSVELTLKIGKKVITIKRVLKRGKSEVKQTEGYIIIDGIKKDMTPVELKTAILNLLNYPKDQISKSKDIIYRFTVYTPQEEMKQILTEDSESRLNTLRKVFDIDKYKTIRENSTIFSNYLKQKSNIISGFISDLDSKRQLKKQFIDDKELIDKQIKESKNHLANANLELLSAKSKSKELSETLKEFNKFKGYKEINSIKLEDIATRKKQNIEDIKIVDKQLSNLNYRKSHIKLSEVSENREVVEKRISENEAKLLNAISKKQELNMKIKACEDKIIMLEKDVDGKVMKDLPLIQAELQQLKDDLSNKTIIVNKLEEKEKANSQLLEEKHKHLFALNNSKDIKKKISKLSNCPTCLQDVSAEYKKRITDAQQEQISSTDEKLVVLSQQEEILKKEIFAIKKVIETIHTKEAKYQKLQNQGSHLEQLSVKNIEKKKVMHSLSEKKLLFTDQLKSLTSHDEIKEKITQDKKILHQINEVLVLRTELKNIDLSLIEKEKRKKYLTDSNINIDKESDVVKEKLANTLEKLKEMQGIDEKTEKINEVIDSLSQKQKQIEVSLSVQNNKLDNIEDNLMQLNKEINDKLSKKQQLHKHLEFLNWQEKHFSELMLTIEKHVLLKAYVEFNSYFQKWFNILMEDEDMSVRLAEDFSVIVEQNGYDTTFDYLSGGEKTSCALAYRLALNKVINEINSSIRTKNIIILDEPTDGFSSEQLDKIRNVLDDLAIKQVIIVSHENKIESYVDKVIRIDKANHISKIINNKV